jgi:hypothetical protein
MAVLESVPRVPSLYPKLKRRIQKSEETIKASALQHSAFLLLHCLDTARYPENYGRNVWVRASTGRRGLSLERANAAHVRGFIYSEPTVEYVCSQRFGAEEIKNIFGGDNLDING